MLLGFVGTLVWDTILLPGAEGPREQWGGAVYSLDALSASLPAGWTVRPIVKVGADLASAALERLGGLPGLDLAPGLRVVPEPNNRVELRYRDAGERSEHLTGGVPPWSWEELEPLVRPLDALYLNFLSGFEMELAAAERLRAGFPRPIYADLHSLLLGPPGDGPRAPRRLPDAERWLRCFDAVQMNEAELGLLLDDPAADPAEILRLGPSLALVTLGGRGARFAAPGGSGLVETPGGALEGDPTGCGDVWGSVAWTSLLDGVPVRAALERANRAAAARMRHPSTAGLHGALREALSD